MISEVRKTDLCLNRGGYWQVTYFSEPISSLLNKATEPNF